MVATDTNVLSTSARFLAHPIVIEHRQERTFVEDEFSRIINAVPALVRTALPDRNINFVKSVNEAYASG
jgi:hypothetical protein